MGNGEFGSVAEGLAALHAVLDGLAELGLPTRSDAEARESVAGLFAVIQRAQAEFLRHVADLDARADAVPGTRPGSVAQAFLVGRLHRTVGEASRDVAAARHLAQAAPQTREVLAAGRVSREHVDVLVRAMDRLPGHLLERVDADGVSGAEKVDEWFAENAERHPSRETKHLVRHLLAHLDPSGEDRFDPLAYQRRHLSSVQDSTGMTVIHGQLDPANAAPWKLALEMYAKPFATRHEKDADGAVVTVIDTRTPGQRRADAVGLIAQIAIGQAGEDSGSGRAGERPRILIHTTPDQLREALTPELAVKAGGTADCQQLGPISLGTLGRLACDSVIARVLQAPNGAILNLGRDVRTVTAAQWRALVARDGGCSIPGCTRGPEFCDAHHIRWWSRGGTSDIDNYALACGGHHTAVHARIWDLVMLNGIPWARPPVWIDQSRRLIRNTYWDDRRRAAGLARQLRLDLGPPGTGPGDRSPGKDSPGKDSPGKDSPGKDSPGKDPPGKDSPGKDSPGKDSPGNDPPGKDPPGREAA